MTNGNWVGTDDKYVGIVAFTCKTELVRPATVPIG